MPQTHPSMLQEPAVWYFLIQQGLECLDEKESSHLPSSLCCLLKHKMGIFIITKFLDTETHHYCDINEYSFVTILRSPCILILFACVKNINLYSVRVIPSKFCYVFQLIIEWRNQLHLWLSFYLVNETTLSVYKAN